MKKRIIIAVAFTACLALCAAVWPQAETVGETPAPPQTPAVTAQGPTVAEVKSGAEIDLRTERRKDGTPQLEPPHETTNEPEPTPVEASVTPNARLTSESEYAPEPIPAPAQAQTVTDLHPAIWFMWRASAGWNTKGQITANTARTFTKTATKSASWADLKNCAA